MITLYLLRHGETDLNVKGVLQGHTDSSLNEKGLLQARELARVLRDTHIDEIFASPLNRAFTTASILAEEKKLQVTKVENLKEMCFGIWEGLDHKKIIADYPEEWKEWEENWDSYATEKGESFQEFFNRISNTIDEILKHNENKKIAIVSHDGVMKAITIHLLKMGAEGFWNFRFEHGKYSLYELKDNHCTIMKINV